MSPSERSGVNSEVDMVRAGQPEPGEFPLDPAGFEGYVHERTPVGLLVLRTIEDLDLSSDNMEVSEMKIYITPHGPINELIREHTGLHVMHPQEGIWTGSISLSQRVETDPGLQQTVQDKLEPGRLERYYKVVNKSSRTRCIDGRPLEGSESNIKPQDRDLGPQVPGGTPMAALAHRIVDIHNIQEDLVFAHDILDIVSRFEKFGFSFGGHIDDIQVEGNTGCGAIDKIPEVLNKIQSKEAQLQLRGLTKTIMGDAYDEDTVDLLIGRMISLASVDSVYFSKDESGEYQYKNTVTEQLRKRRNETDPVARLMGPHKEVALCINFVPETTFDRDHFNHDTDGEIQMFGFDFWRVQEVAAVLYPDNPALSLEERMANIRLQQQYITVRCLLGVSVAMTLTDGSIDLLTRTAEQV